MKTLARHKTNTCDIIMTLCKRKMLLDYNHTMIVMAAAIFSAPSASARQLESRCSHETALIQTGVAASSATARHTPSRTDCHTSTRNKTEMRDA